MGLFPKRGVDYLALAGIPFGPNSQVFFVDAQAGSDSNDGLSPYKPLLTLATAYGKCTTNQNDCVCIIGGPTGLNPAAAVTWAKDYTHLVGLSADLPGMGQRARIVNASTVDAATLFTLSGDGCIIKNIQFYDGKDKAEDGSCLVVSGDRNLLENVFVAGMGHATPAGRAGSWSAYVSGSENTFKDCTIGIDTIKRTAANSELVVVGGRNRFIHCDFRSYSETAGKFLVTVDATAADLRDTIFDDCLFFNYTENWANGIDNAFHMAGANTHFVILRGNCQLVGVNSGWADTVTHIYGAGAAPNAGYGVSLNPTT